MSATPFSSVKLPAHLVEQARQAAQPIGHHVHPQEQEPKPEQRAADIAYPATAA